jgi:hypothetical protein
MLNPKDLAPSLNPNVFIYHCFISDYSDEEEDAVPKEKKDWGQEDDLAICKRPENSSKPKFVLTFVVILTKWLASVPS